MCSRGTQKWRPIELAEEVFHMRCARGAQYVTVFGGGEQPIHATGVGLLLYAKATWNATHGSAAAAGGIRTCWSE